MNIDIGEEYIKALQTVNEMDHGYDTLGELLEEMIEDHLIRESGRCGYISPTSVLYVLPTREDAQKMSSNLKPDFKIGGSE